MSKSKELNQRDLYLAIVGLISFHLVAEATRRFVVYSDLVYFAADFAVMLLALKVVKIGRCRIDVAAGFLLCIYITWGLFSLFYSGESILLAVVGVRPLLLAVLGYVIAENYFRLAEDCYELFYRLIGVVTIVVLLVAVIQVALGPDAPINSLPSDTGAEFGGRGDYGVEGEGLEWLFRPTSIFMHTGRLGQYSFFLALSLIVPMLIVKEIKQEHLMYAIASIVLVLVSGQRAAGVFILLSVFISLVLFGSSKILIRLVFFAILFGAIFLVMAPNVSDVIFGRFFSGFTGGSSRVSESIKYWQVGFSEYPIFGKGLGFFSFGGKAFGGDVYYQYMLRFGGGGETSWLRVQGEVGILGALVFFFLVLKIVAKSYTRARSAIPQSKAIHLIAMMFALFSIIWGFTHDIYGNYLFITPMFALFGASAGLSRRDT